MDGDAELGLYDTETNEGDSKYCTIDRIIEIMEDRIKEFSENEIKSPVSNSIKTNRVFDSGSQRDDDTDKPLPNHLDAYVRMRYGYLLRDGATHYGKGNWKKGQPKETAIESLHRHLGWFEINHELGIPQDEDHLSAMIFNIQLIMKNEQKEGITVDNYYKKK